MEANLFARLEGFDVVYIDPPYTTTQYANSYHVLETIARYDNPENLSAKLGVARIAYCLNTPIDSEPRLSLRSISTAPVQPCTDQLFKSVDYPLG